MKTFLLFIICLLQLNRFEAQTNVYHPFPSDNSAVWNVSYVDYWFIECRKYSYSITGDTTINGLAYHKIGKQGQEYVMDYYQGNPNIPYCTNQVTQNFNYYSGAIREDLVQKKIYFIEPTLSIESVLYDFTLNVGDTIKGYFSSGPPSLVILSIDSILIGTQFRKIWNIDPSNGWGGTPQIIEGIGSIYGLLEVPYVIEKRSRALECFSENNQTLYPSYNATSGCNLLTSTKEVDGTKKLLSLFPNPNNGKFELIVNSQKINFLEITDVLGNLILKSEINKEATVIDLSDKLNGIYFVKISDSTGNVVVKKIVKQ